MSRKVIIITNIPSPYRVLLFDQLSSIFNGDLFVVYYKKIEKNREWNIPRLSHNSFFLKNTIFARFNIHFDIFPFLIKEKPDIIIAAGFTPTIIFAFIYSKLSSKKFIVFTDSWLHSVQQLKFYHRLIRKYIIPRADASIAVGKKGVKYLLKYGSNLKSIFISPLAIDNSYYLKFYKPIDKKKFDVIFSGQFIERKMPFFVIEVLKGLQEKNYNVKFLLIGSGPLEREIIKQLVEYNICYIYPGFIQQEDLPKYYSNSKLLLFPTTDDPWGLVANEACAVGTPVITCENAGVANDLVIHNYNGYVLPLSLEVWVKYTLSLLQNNDLLEQFSKNSIQQVKNYSIEKGALGIIDSIEFVFKHEHKK